MNVVGIRSIRVTTADNTVTNSTTLAVISDFTLALRAGQKAYIRFKGQTSTAAAAGLKILLNAPAAPTIYQAFLIAKETATGNTLFGRDIVAEAAIGITDDITAFTIDFYINNGANAGNLTFEFAQNVQDNSDTKILAGCVMEITLLN